MPRNSMSKGPTSGEAKGIRKFERKTMAGVQREKGVL